MLEVAPREYSPRYERPDFCETAFGGGQLFGRRMTIAAAHVDAIGIRRRPFQVFNGKIARPRLRSDGETRGEFDFSAESKGAD
jgi:hypothetical protein